MRNWGIDLLRGIAALGIVGCHLSLAPLTNGGTWVRHFCDFNVAVFAVLAGLCMKFFTPQDSNSALQTTSVLSYIKKRCARILPTYLVWSLVYLAASLVFQLAGRGVEARFSDSVYWVRVVFCGSASCHLWFLICLLYAQIAIRILSLRMPAWALLAIGTASVVWASLGGTWYHTYLLRLLGFVCVGFALHGEMPLQIGLGVLSVVALVAHLLLSGIIPGFIRDLVAVIPLVLFFRSIGQRSLSAHRICGVGVTNFVSLLASTSMAVFLVHPIFTRSGSVIVGRLATAPYSAGVVLIEWFGCWLLAMSFAVVAIRIPYLRRICQ